MLDCAEAANQVARSVTAVLAASEMATDSPQYDPALLASVQEAAAEVQKALEELLEHVRLGSVQAHQVSPVYLDARFIGSCCQSSKLTGLFDL